MKLAQQKIRGSSISCTYAGACFAILFELASAGAAHATEQNAVADMRYAAVNVQADADSNRQALGELSLSLGSHAWVHGGGGNAKTAAAQGDLNTRIVDAGFGLRAEQLEFMLSFVRRQDDETLRQRDWIGALNWRGEQGGVGVDGFARSADSETTTSTPRTSLPPLVTQVRESADGRGFGLHGDVDVAARVNLFAGAMSYRYDFSITSSSSSATGNTGQPLLSQLLISDSADAVTGVSRDQAFIDRSYRLGATYRFDRASLSGQYRYDREAETQEITHTAEMLARFLLDHHWVLSPMLGYASGDTQHAAFGGVTASFTW